MKKKITHIISTLAIALLLSVSVSSIAQGPPPPPGGAAGGGGTGSEQLGGEGGGAPIGGGLFILLGLGAAYAGRKLYIINKESLEE
ncbi:MAG: hypothetical protein C0595_01110 [Marinilabiliales bacterium]|mgnify:FL=1|nr:MAG: hypothetical protein C0595_01110 [Marinilabiliales bacterium]